MQEARDEAEADRMLEAAREVAVAALVMTLERERADDFDGAYWRNLSFAELVIDQMTGLSAWDAAEAEIARRDRARRPAPVTVADIFGGAR